MFMLRRTFGKVLCSLAVAALAAGCAQSNPTPRPFRGTTAMTHAEQLALAARSFQVYVLSPDNASLGYLDGQTVYVMADVGMTFDQLPSTSPCPQIIDPPKPGKLVIRNIRMPLYYVRQAGGANVVGFFEPIYGLFLQWRDAGVKPDEARGLGSPVSEAMELDAHRIAQTILIPAPDTLGNSVR